jgi:hypothetical protein
MVFGVMFVLADPAARASHTQPDDILPQSSESNQAPFWEAYLVNERGINDASCDKLDQAGDSAFEMPKAPDGETWVLLVVKQATSNYVYYDPIGGHSYPSTGGQGPGFSHLIVCSVVTPTTEPSITEATVPEPSITEATVAPTSITSPPTTAEVLGTSITSAPPTTAAVDPVDTLPFTGVESGTPALLALALIGIGALALVATRRAED